MKAKWVGFEIPDEFVVGYGIDYAQRNRNLPYIGEGAVHLRWLTPDLRCTHYAQRMHKAYARDAAGVKG